MCLVAQTKTAEENAALFEQRALDPFAVVAQPVHQINILDVRLDEDGQRLPWLQRADLDEAVLRNVDGLRLHELALRRPLLSRRRGLACVGLHRFHPPHFNWPPLYGPSV